jgi:hypothetical protein
MSVDRENAVGYSTRLVLLSSSSGFFVPTPEFLAPAKPYTSPGVLLSLQIGEASSLSVNNRLLLAECHQNIPSPHSLLDVWSFERMAKGEISMFQNVTAELYAVFLIFLYPIQQLLAADFTGLVFPAGLGGNLSPRLELFLGQLLVWRRCPRNPCVIRST